MTRALAVLLLGIAAAAGAVAAGLAYFSVRIIYAVATFRGEGSLGHVGMTIAAGVYPLATVLVAAVAWASGRAGWRRWHAGPPE
jgi:hypothetical protein